MKILFVCKANVIRSAIAERLAVVESVISRRSDLEFFSAGVKARGGEPMEPHAQKVLVELGGNPDCFRSRRVTIQMVDDSNLILTMTATHRDLVLIESPLALAKTFTLGEAVRLIPYTKLLIPDVLFRARPHHPPQSRDDIADPVNLGMDSARQVGNQIADLVSEVVSTCPV